LKVIGNFFSSPGILTEKMYAYAAYDLQKQSQKLEEGEDIELLPVSFIDALDMIRHGEITDGKTIATILMYKEFGARVG
jgi:ADP-ribose pyrophosphatase